MAGFTGGGGLASACRRLEAGEAAGRMPALRSGGSAAAAMIDDQTGCLLDVEIYDELVFDVPERGH